MLANALDRDLLEAHFRLARAINKQVRMSEKMLNLSLAQGRALFFLTENPGAQINEVATFFQVTIPTATVLVDKLVQSKLAVRREDKNDRRLVRVYLTSNGRSFLLKANKMRVLIFGRLLSKLTLNDKKIFLRILNTITAD